MAEIENLFSKTQHARDAQCQAEGMACRRGAALVFEDVFFHLTSGQALCVRGANGSGKSSLLRQLAGLLPLAAGALTRPDPHKYTHYLGHADGLKAALSIGETLAYEAALAGQGADHAADLTARLGLAGRDWQYVGDLSAGQKRRLTLARLLLDPRPLWLLDEPMTALDEDGRALVGALAKAHLASGGMIIAASHEPLGFANAELVLGAQI
jgi:heme exporter protein A